MTYLFCTMDEEKKLTKWAESDNSMAALSLLVNYFTNRKNFLTPEDMIVIEKDTGRYMKLEDFARFLEVSA